MIKFNILLKYILVAFVANWALKVLPISTLQMHIMGSNSDVALAEESPSRFLNINKNFNFKGFIQEPYISGDAVVVRYPSYTLVDVNNPFVRDLTPEGLSKPDIFILYGTGLGSIRNNSHVRPIVYLKNRPNLPLKVLYAGDSPGLVGLDQLNIEIPKDYPSFSGDFIIVCDQNKENCNIPSAINFNYLAMRVRDKR